MKITDNKVLFSSSENPLKHNLTLEAQALLPETYKGDNDSMVLADVYSQALIRGVTVDELSQVQVDDLPDVIDSFSIAQVVMSRFKIEYDQTDFVSVFYTLKNDIDFNDTDSLNYLAQVYSSLSTLVQSKAVGSTVRHLYSLNRGRDRQGRVPVSEVKKFILLNKALRSEGVVLTATEVYYCSLNWKTDEVFKLLETGISLSESLKLYDIGFKTIDDIVEYSGGIPEDWIDLILK